MRTVLLANLRVHAARLVATVLAVVLAVGFVVATLVLNETSRATALASAGAPYLPAAAVVTSLDGAPVGVGALLADIPSVGAVAPSWQTVLPIEVPERAGVRTLLVGSVAEAPELRWEQLAAGSLPDEPGEIAVDRRSGAALGDVLTVLVPAPVDRTGGGSGEPTESSATVTGIVEFAGSPYAGLFGQAVVTPAQAQAWGAQEPSELRVAARPGVSPDTVLADVSAALSDRPVSVLSGAQQARSAADDLTRGHLQLTAVLLVFATVAVLVAGLVIANTFAVLLAQRTRELALLRALGATGAQVRRSVLGEALLTGLVASALGTGAGIGLAAAVAALSGGAEATIPLVGLSVPPWAVGAGLLVGTLVTLLAAAVPARVATRTSPLAAARPMDAAPLRSRPGAARVVLGLTLLLPGLGLLWIGADRAQVLVAVGGGVLAFLGVVLLAQLVIPVLVAGAGRLASRIGGIPAQLAAGNASRAPRRTAATALALLVGVTLTAAMVVGAATTRESSTAAIAAAYPIDVVVTQGSDPLPRSLAGELDAVTGVGASAPVSVAELVGPDGQPVQVFGVEPGAGGRAVRSEASFRLPEPGRAVLPPWLATAYGVASGDAVSFTTGGRALDAVVTIGDDDQSEVLVTADQLTATAPDAAPAAVWLRVADDADASATVERITQASGTAAPGSAVTGMLAQRAQLDGLLNGLLLVVTGLLAIAVLIALIGVGNTLALSVVERRQENGLLRALGLTRGQLRLVLAWEAALISGVAGVLGVAMGIGYGLTGVNSVLGGVGDVVPVIPWLQLVAIVVVATGAGLLASVLPARRAARTSPVAAIAG